MTDKLPINDSDEVKAITLTRPKAKRNTRGCALKAEMPILKAKKYEKCFIYYDNGVVVPSTRKMDDSMSQYVSEIDDSHKKANDKKLSNLRECMSSLSLRDCVYKKKNKKGKNTNKNKIHIALPTLHGGFQPQSLMTDAVWSDCASKAQSVHHWLYGGSHLGESFLQHYLNVPREIQPHVNLLEDVCLLVHHIVLSRSTFDRYIAIVNFCKLRGSRLGFTSTLICVASDLFRASTESEGLKSKYNNMYSNIQQHVNDSMSYSAQSSEHDNIFSEIRGYLGMYDKLKETTIYKKLYKFALYVLSLGLLDGVNIDFNSCNFSKFEAEAIRRTHRPGIDMVHCMIDTICFVCDRGLYYFKTGDKMAILHSGASYEKWIVDSERLLRESKLLSNPEPHGIVRCKFLSELKDNIEKGKSIVRFTANLEKYERMTLQRILSELQLCESAELTRKAAQQPRKDPFGILIHGSSSICKSQLKQILFYHYGKIFGLPTSADYMYTRSPADEFWSGFNSTQWCIVMDDIAFLKPNGDVDPTLLEMLQVKNSVPYVPPQADLCDKGRTPVRAELLIGTTNTKDLNLFAYFACPFAVARRMSYVVTATIKPEYSKHTIMADSTKIPVTQDGEYMNIWDFQIAIPIPASDLNIDNQRTKYEVIHSFTEINDFLAWYIEVAKQHEASQVKALAADSTMMNVSVCSNCYRPTSGCRCDFSEQAEELLEQSVVSDSSSTVEEITSENNIIDELQLCDFSPIYRFKLWTLCKIIEHQSIEFPNFGDFSLDARYFLAIFLFCWIMHIFSFLFSHGFLRFSLYIITIIASVSIVKYFWIICAYYYMWKFGDLWKLRLARRICGCDLQSARLIFRLSGKVVRDTKFSDKRLVYLVSFLSSATFVATLYNLWRKTGMEAQGSVGTVPVPTATEKPTFYYHDPYKPTGVDISGESKCAQGDILLNKLTRNTARLNFRMIGYPGKVFSTTGVNVKGNLWVFNKHAYKGDHGSVDIIFEDTTQNVSRNTFNISVSPRDVRTLKDSDLAIMEIKAVPPGPNLLPYFPKNKLVEGRYCGTYIMRDRTGTIRHVKVSDIHTGICPVFSVPGYHGKVNEDTQQGDCGSMCLADINGSQVIMGSHTCGKPGKIFFQHISQNMLEKLVGTYIAQVDCGELPISAPGFERKLIPIHQKSVVRFLEKGTVGVIGSFAGYRAKSKSKVVRTHIHPYAVKHGYDDNYGPPVMDWRPWRIAISDMVAQPHTYSSDIMQSCEDAFFNDIVTQLSDKLNSLEVYTLDVSLNGVDGVTYVDSINKSTSAGNPFKRSKKHFITVDDMGKITHVDDVIMDRISSIENCYSRGQRFHPQFCAHLKDDPMPRSKIESGKTRVFVGGEFAWMLVVRRYFLSHVRLIQNNPFVFEAMPGIVAQSVEWQKLYNYVTHFGQNNMVGGDYKCFDKKMSAAFVLSAFNILIRLAERAGWSSEDIMVLRCIASDTAYFEVDFNGDLLQVQGNPSGHPLTVIINCLVNSLYMRYAYSIISGKHVSTFQQNVKLATYGDDNLMCVSSECPKFNHTRISVALKLIGVEYTMADKEAESVPYISIDQASFLKRSFRWDADIGAIVGPLENSSFDKMLTTCVKSPSLCSEAHSICVIETALREYFFHGKEVFDRKKLMFEKIIEESKLTDWVRDSTFPDYYDLVYEFWMRFGDRDSAIKYSFRHA